MSHVLRRELYKDLREKSCVDIQFVCLDEKEVYAHKIILAFYSPYLKNCFTKFRNNPSTLVLLPTVPAEVVEKVIHMMYLERVIIQRNLLSSFLELHKLFQLPDFSVTSSYEPDTVQLIFKPSAAANVGEEKTPEREEHVGDENNKSMEKNETENHNDKSGENKYLKRKHSKEKQVEVIETIESDTDLDVTSSDQGNSSSFQQRREFDKDEKSRNSPTNLKTSGFPKVEISSPYDFASRKMNPYANFFKRRKSKTGKPDTSQGKPRLEAQVQKDAKTPEECHISEPSSSKTKDVKRENLKKILPFVSSDEDTDTNQNREGETSVSKSAVCRTDGPEEVKNKLAKSKNFEVSKFKNVCGSCVKYYTDIKEHIKIHKPLIQKRRNQCPECKKVFYRKQNVRGHVCD